MEFRAASDIYWDGIRVIAATTDAQGRLVNIAEAVKFTMKPHEPHGFVVEPTFQFTQDEARSLMNALWSAGVRPTDLQNPSGEINRMEAHLSDMRKLVFQTNGSPGDSSR